MTDQGRVTDTDEAEEVIDRLRRWLGEHPQVARLWCEYNGSGDSGAVERFTATDADGAPVEVGVEVEFLLWDLAYAAHPGFEDNEGGFGTVEVADGRVTILHTWWVETTEEADPVVRAL